MRRLLAVAALAAAVPLLRRAAARSNTQVHRVQPRRATPPQGSGATAATMTQDLTADPATAGGNA